MTKAERKANFEKVKLELTAWALDYQKANGKYPTKAEIKAKSKELTQKYGFDPATMLMIFELIMKLIELLKKKPTPTPTPAK